MTKLSIFVFNEFEDSMVYITNQSRNYFIYKMEKGLYSGNSLTKTHKLYKKNRGSLSSLDESALKHYEKFPSSSLTNFRKYLQNPSMRNTFADFKSPLKTQQSQMAKPKERKGTSQRKRSNIKDTITGLHKYSTSNFTSSITPINKSKCASILDFEDQIEQSEISKLKFIYQIGFGGFGKVWKVLKRKTYKQYAMKQINKKKVIEKDNVESIMNERYVLSMINHPFLINMHSAFQDNRNLYLTMDYLRGADLRYHICYKDTFTEPQIKFIIVCILVGLEYVHEKGIIHRDIKPENIVFQENGYVRLTDFGIAKVQSSSNLPLKFQSSGTPGYMAPQILCKMPYTFTSDFFALGIIIYELVLGHRPYDGKNRQEIRQDILAHQATLLQEQLPKGFSKNILSFVNGLLQRNPEQRLGHNGFKQIKNHKWLKDIKWKSLQRKQIVPPFQPHVVCQTKQYLDEIVLYNQLRTNDENNSMTITLEDQKKFADYDYKKSERSKMIKIQKGKHIGQNSVAVSKSKPILSKNGSQLIFGTLMSKPNNFLKKNRRNSQERIVY